MEKIIDMCGHYERGSIVKDAKINTCLSSEKFYFITKVLTDDERDAMKEIPSIPIRDKLAMYLCNPLNCELGQMKIYYDFATQEVERCIIEDMYCVPPSQDESRLILKLDIVLCDSGGCLRGINCGSIYDFSQRTSHLIVTEEEAKLARLDFDGEQADIDDISRQFKNYLSSSRRDTFDLKICGYDKDKRVYRVDLVGDRGGTFLQSLKNANNNKIGKEEPIINVPGSEGPSNLEQVRQLLPKSPYKRGEFKNLENAHRKPEKIGTYYGAYDYFKRNIDKRFATDINDPYVKKCMFNVAALDWFSPHQLAIVPADKDFSLGQKRFVDAINSLKCMKDISGDDPCESNLYQPGQFVVFKNVFKDHELGKWLRGVVVSMCCYNEHNLIIGQRKTFEEKLENFKVVKRLIQDKKLSARDLVYRVRSVDYGYECRCSPISMRPVKDLIDFKRIGTWSLRCRLFGVHKFKGETNFSKETKDVFESWMREKMLEEGTPNAFHAIFRLSFKTTNRVDMFDKLIDVSLFHRYYPQSTRNVSPFLRTKQRRFDYINWHLVELGLASSCEKDETSNIQLEDHVMNVLGKHGLI